jgi:hypothetical protein
MDSKRFDALARTVGGSISRRRAMGVVATATVAAAAERIGLAEPASARRAGPNVTGQAEVQPENLFGCKNFGELCKGNASVCCSGSCVGKKPKKKKNGKKTKDTRTCGDHNVGGCAGQDACTSTGVSCGDSGVTGVCFLTTGQASFCGRPGGQVPPGFSCTNCNTDQDCVNLGWPSESACIVCSNCQFQTSNGTACVGPAAG